MEGFKLIPLTQGKSAMVSPEDYERVNQFKWQALTGKGKRTGYARRSIYNPNGKRVSISMHRFILGVDSADIQCDHKNHNGFDNRRSNLRLCNASQQAQNRRRKSTNTSGFTGVSKNYYRWMARIQSGGDRIFIGNFNSPEKAARAYDAKAIELHGEFAVLNFPKELEVKK